MSGSSAAAVTAQTGVVLGEWRGSAGQQRTCVWGLVHRGCFLCCASVMHGDASSPGHASEVCSVCILACAQAVQPSPAS